MKMPKTAQRNLRRKVHFFLELAEIGSFSSTVATLPEHYLGVNAGKILLYYFLGKNNVRVLGESSS